ncbi:hypothetical protein BH09VER1_BH09VER1_20580 [soil metagenome]
MKKDASVFTVLIAVFFLAAFVSFLSIFFYSKFSQGPGPSSAHAWIHSQLGLTAEQEKAIEPIEHAYHLKCCDLEMQMNAGNQELARAILADGNDSPRVQAAIAKIHLAMGELQGATIGHVFAMKPALTPEQYNKLLHMTADALGKLDADHAEE